MDCSRRLQLEYYTPVNNSRLHIVEADYLARVERLIRGMNLLACIFIFSVLLEVAHLVLFPGSLLLAFFLIQTLCSECGSGLMREPGLMNS